MLLVLVGAGEENKIAVFASSPAPGVVMQFPDIREAVRFIKERCRGADDLNVSPVKGLVRRRGFYIKALVTEVENELFATLLTALKP